MQIEKNRVQEIRDLHNEIVVHLRMSLEKAIRIGELLIEQKSSMKHGDFTPWMEANIPFTDRTARNYMRLYREKDKLKTETLSGLNDAYQLLTEPKSPADRLGQFMQEHQLSEIEMTTLCYAESVNIMREETGDWEEAFEAISKESGMPVDWLIRFHHFHFGAVCDLPVRKPTSKDIDRLNEAIGNIVSNFIRKGVK